MRSRGSPTGLTPEELGIKEFRGHMDKLDRRWGQAGTYHFVLQSGKCRPDPNARSEAMRSRLPSKNWSTLDIPILFGLHNFDYHDTTPFESVDYVVVPTEYCRQQYWNTLGLASLKLPLVVDPAEVGPAP